NSAASKGSTQRESASLARVFCVCVAVGAVRVAPAGAVGAVSVAVRAVAVALGRRLGRRLGGTAADFLVAQVLLAHGVASLAGVAAYGPEVLGLLEQGLAPAEAIERALADDPERETRQLGVVAADGRAASHTGSECLAWAGHRFGEGYAVQGNILAGEAVVAE